MRATSSSRIGRHVVEAGDHEADDLGAVVGAPERHPVVRQRVTFEGRRLLGRERITLQRERRRAVAAQHVAVRRLGGHEVALCEHVTADEVGDAVTEQRAHEVRADGRVITRRTGIERARDVVHQPRNLHLDVGTVAPEDVGALHVMVERAVRVDAVTIVEHGEQVVDAGERRVHG